MAQPDSLASYEDVREKRLRMLKAYADKREFASTTDARLRATREKEMRIGPLSPLKRPKETKFNHKQGCTMAAKGQLPPSIEDKWWQKKPCQPGELCNKIQRKLSHEHFFTGTQKYKTLSTISGEITAGSDAEMHRALRLLSHESATSLAAHRSGGSLHDEISFRVHLRESVNL